MGMSIVGIMYLIPIPFSYYINKINYNMHAIYLLLNLCFKSNIKFKYKPYSNHITIYIVYIII